MDIVEEVEEKTYNLSFESGKFIFTDNATHRSGPISVEVAYANSNQIDVDVKDSAVKELAHLGL